MDVHLVVNLGLLIAVAFGFLWSVLRELHIHAMQKAQERTAEKLAEHLGAVNRLIDKMADDVSSSSTLSREQQSGVINFLRDIEHRLTMVMHDNREWIREHMRGVVFNNQVGERKTDIHGGQNNVGQTDIHGNQRQE